MIRGSVNSRSQAIIPGEVRGADGSTQQIEATIDTGFSGFLTLPAPVVAALGLTYDRTEVYTLADDRDVAFDLHRATVVWDGRDRPVDILATGTAPLVGMAMLCGAQLYVDVVDGGDVRIEVRP